MHTPKLTLISDRLCPYAQRVAIVAFEKRVPFERVYIDLYEKPSWFTALSPTGKVPVLTAGEVVLFESVPIIEYIDEVTAGSLHPSDARERARQRAWITVISAIQAEMSELHRAPERQSFESLRDFIESKLRQLESAALAPPYFAGSNFHLIDAAAGPLFRYFDVYDHLGGFTIFAASARLSEWRKALALRPSVSQAVGANYAQQLTAFLQSRNSYASELLKRASTLKDSSRIRGERRDLESLP